MSGAAGQGGEGRGKGSRERCRQAGRQACRRLRAQRAACSVRPSCRACRAIERSEGWARAPATEDIRTRPSRAAPPPAPPPHPHPHPHPTPPPPTTTTPPHTPPHHPPPTHQHLCPLPPSLDKQLTPGQQGGCDQGVGGHDHRPGGAAPLEDPLSFRRLQLLILDPPELTPPPPPPPPPDPPTPPSHRSPWFGRLGAPLDLAAAVRQGRSLLRTPACACAHAGLTPTALLSFVASPLLRPAVR